MTSLLTTIILIIAVFALAVIINSVVCSGKCMDEAAEIMAISNTGNLFEI